jgi:2-phosphosulfolactate phosphatase
MTHKPVVAIDCFPENLPKHRDAEAIVAVDVIRATTTAVTAVAGGRRCFPAASLEVATALADRMPEALLVGELGGSTPYGFDLTNSPYEIERYGDVERPMILLSTSGTRVICGAPDQHMYVACLRNFRAQAAHLAANHRNVAVIGAGARGEFREEDELCCAWIAEALVAAGFAPADAATQEAIARWHGASVDLLWHGNSARYLLRTDQEHDLRYVLTHIDDLSNVFELRDGEVVQLAVAASTG